MWHKKRAPSLVMLGILAALISENAFSHHVTYSIEYSTTSTKKPAFENTEINAQLFRGGVPAGYFKIKPNSNNEFTVPNDYGSNIAIAAFSVKGQNKLHLVCSGNASPGKHKLVMECISK